VEAYWELIAVPEWIMVSSQQDVLELGSMVVKASML
jgi:hypothetical protein